MNVQSNPSGGPLEAPGPNPETRAPNGSASPPFGAAPAPAPAPAPYFQYPAPGQPFSPGWGAAPVPAPVPGQAPKTPAPLVLGILSMVFAIIPVIGIALAVFGLVSAAKQRRNGCSTMCVIGLLLSMVVVAAVVGRLGRLQEKAYRHCYRHAYYNYGYYGY